MDFSSNDSQPDDPSSLTPARRRRARRRLIHSLSADERANYLEQVSRRAAPSFDFFLFSLLAGAVFAFALLLDSPHLLILGALLAPLMAPVIGISLGTVLGSTRSFGRSLMGLLIGGFLVVLAGSLAGFIARVWPSSTITQAQLHTQLTWPPFLLIAVGAVLTSVTLVRSKHPPNIPSVAVAYGLYAPLAGAGFGLGSGASHLWPDGLVVFTIHLAWATLLGAGTLAFMGFRPYSLFGYSIGGAVALVGIILAIGFGGAGAAVGGQVALPTPTASPTLTATLTPTTPPTSPPPTVTQTPTATATITLTPSITPSPSPTPVEAILQVNGELGAVIREQPGFSSAIVSSLLNGSLVQILPDEAVAIEGQSWVRVLILGTEDTGWIIGSLLVTATPFAPSETPTPSNTASPAAAEATPTP